MAAHASNVDSDAAPKTLMMSRAIIFWNADKPFHGSAWAFLFARTSICVFRFIRVGGLAAVDIGVPEHHPMLLATNHVVEFSRLSWLSHDAMIRAGIRAHGPQPTRPVPVSPNPSWLSLEGYDWATCVMSMAWLSFGCNQFMINMIWVPTRWGDS